MIFSQLGQPKISNGDRGMSCLSMTLSYIIASYEEVGLLHIIASYEEVGLLLSWLVVGSIDNFVLISFFLGRSGIITCLKHFLKNG